MSRSDLIGSYSERTTCPRCGDRIRLEDVRVFVKPNGPYPKCPACGTSIRVSIVYQRLIMLMAFALAWLIPYFIGLRAYVLVAWIPFYLLAVLLVPNIAKVTVPPKLEDAESVTRRSLLRRNVGLFVSLWTYWVFFIFLNGVLSAAVEGKRAFSGYLSGPWLVRLSVCCGVRNGVHSCSCNCSRQHFYLRSLLFSSDHSFPSRISSEPYYTTWNQSLREGSS